MSTSMPEPGVERPPGLHRCALCGEVVEPADARLLQVCSSHVPHERWNTAFKVRPAVDEDGEDILRLVLAYWGHEDQVAFGRTFPVLRMRNLVADAGGAVAGLVSLHLEGEDGTIVALAVPPLYQGLGVGSALLSAAIGKLREAGARRIRLATTNDDLPALQMYQRHGFVLEEVVPGEVARLLEARLGRVPEGFAGIPVRDEIRLRLED